MAGVKKEDQTSSSELKEDTDSKSTKEIVPPSHNSVTQMSAWLMLNILSTVQMMEIVRAMAIEYLGLDFSTTYDDITALKFIAGDSLFNLKHACETQAIGCFLQCVFEKSGAADVLGKGNFSWKLYIQKMSRKEYGHYSQLTARREEQRQIWSLFADELDPTELFTTLQNMGLVGEKEKDKMMPLKTRKERMDYLIGRLVGMKGPDQGYSILVTHCVKNDYDFLSKINDIYGADAANLNLRRRIDDECLPGQKLFTACVISKIHGSESPKQVDINIENRKWHGDTLGKYQDALTRCQVTLVRCLDVKTVCMYIVQDGVLDDVMVRDILEQTTTTEKIKELIIKVNQRDPSTYNKFKECLVQAGQAFLKEKLEEEESNIAREMEEEKMEEIIIMVLAPDWESTEEKAITTEKQHLKRKRSNDDDNTASSVPS